MTISCGMSTDVSNDRSNVASDPAHATPHGVRCKHASGVACSPHCRPPARGVNPASHPTASLMRAHNVKARARHTGGSAAGASQARIAARGTVANDTPVNTVSTLEYPPAGQCASATNRHEGTRTPSASDRDLTRHTHRVGTRGYSQVLADGMGGASNRTVGRQGSDTRQRELELGIEVLQRLHLRAFVLGRRRHLHSTKECWPADA